LQKSYTILKYFFRYRYIERPKNTLKIPEKRPFISSTKRLFCGILYEGDKMNITQFIKSHKKLNELPFLVVFRVIQGLCEMGMIKNLDGDPDVDRV
jgi:hypothetical protein